MNHKVFSKFNLFHLYWLVVHYLRIKDYFFAFYDINKLWFSTNSLIDFKGQQVRKELGLGILDKWLCGCYTITCRIIEFLSNI